MKEVREMYLVSEFGGARVTNQMAAKLLRAIGFRRCSQEQYIKHMQRIAQKDAKATRRPEKTIADLRETLLENAMEAAEEALLSMIQSEGLTEPPCKIIAEAVMEAIEDEIGDLNDVKATTQLLALGLDTLAAASRFQATTGQSAVKPLRAWGEVQISGSPEEQAELQLVTDLADALERASK